MQTIRYSRSWVFDNLWGHSDYCTPCNPVNSVLPTSIAIWSRVVTRVLSWTVLRMEGMRSRRRHLSEMKLLRTLLGFWNRVINRRRVNGCHRFKRTPLPGLRTNDFHCVNGLPRRLSICNRLRLKVLIQSLLRMGHLRLLLGHRRLGMNRSHLFIDLYHQFNGPPPALMGLNDC